MTKINVIKVQKCIPILQADSLKIKSTSASSILGIAKV